MTDFDIEAMFPTLSLVDAKVRDFDVKVFIQIHVATSQVTMNDSDGREALLQACR